MGVLDDAIREHLDLKRRRGADPAEIERAEREALGPVRRGPQTQDIPDAQAQPRMPYDDDQDLGYGDDPAVQYDDEGEQPDDDDVLEETPEFLQDTPDHDRLWFEQKPPRDFDFDG